MQNTHKPFLLILSSPSGTGKTTLSKELLASDKNIELSISCTTREKRDKEEHGKDYYFISENDFLEMIESGKLLEHTSIYKNRYGTPRIAVEKLLSEGKDVLFDIEWDGTKQLKEKIKENIVSIFVLPPSMQELEKRLRVRGTETEDKIQTRMTNAKIEISHWKYYDYVIINNSIETSMLQIRSILMAERLKRNKLNEFTENLLNE